MIVYIVLLIHLKIVTIIICGTWKFIQSVPWRFTQRD